MPPGPGPSASRQAAKGRRRPASSLRSARSPYAGKVYLPGYSAAAGRVAATALLLLALAGGRAGAGEMEGVVVRVVDGDTIKVRIEGVVHSVRYIGVNAPELRHPTRGREPGARDAAEVNRRLLGDRPVRLDLDVRARDRNGRLLAYVYADRLMVNAEMVRLGYAQAMTVPPNVKHQRLFLELEREARAAGRGLWKESRTAGP